MANLGLTSTETISTRSTLLASDVIECLIIAKSIREASILLEVSEDTLEQTLRRNFSKKIGKLSKEKWDLYLLRSAGMCRCYKCGSITTLDRFIKDKALM